MNTSYFPPGRLERLRGNPLHPFVERYVTQAEEQNYKPKTISWHVQLFTRCSRWLHRTRRQLRDLNEKLVERFLVQELPRRESWAGAMPAFGRLLAILRVEGVVPPAKPTARTSVQRLADDYRSYLSNERGLRSATIYNYARHVDQFLNELFGQGKVKFSALRTQEVIEFVKSQSRQHSRARMLQVTSALRSFLRFTHYRGYTATDLAPVIPIVANWRKATLPKNLSAEAVERVLNACDWTTAVGRRNHAILLLLARLGLRAGEVMRLSAVRGFARYRSGIDSTIEIPPLGLLPKKRQPALPYIYSDTEITRLLEGAKNYPSWNRFPGPWWARFQGWTFSCIFGLLAVTGMRIGEVLNLRTADIDWSEGVLTIRNAKFGKSRLIPLHRSTLKALRTFLQHRDRFFARLNPQPEASHLFVTSRGSRLDVRHINRVFLCISRQIGLRGPDANHGPRLHDFRHRFAIETLLQWYRDDEPADRLLPVLSTYLGHTHVTGTYWYLRGTPELMAAAGERLEQRWKGVE